MEMVLGNRTINRRAFLTGAALLPFLGGAAGAATETLPLITVFKDAVAVAAAAGSITSRRQVFR